MKDTHKLTPEMRILLVDLFFTKSRPSFVFIVTHRSKIKFSWLRFPELAMLDLSPILTIIILTSSISFQQIIVLAWLES